MIFEALFFIGGGLVVGRLLRQSAYENELAAHRQQIISLKTRLDQREEWIKALRQWSEDREIKIPPIPEINKNDY